MFIPKSRWATAECFLASEAYNDIYVPNERTVFQELVDAGKIQAAEEASLQSHCAMVRSGRADGQARVLPLHSRCSDSV